MSELEQAVLGNDDELSFYLETVSVSDFRNDIQKLKEQNQNGDIQQLKARIRAVVDAA